MLKGRRYAKVTTIGDSFAIVAILIGIGLTAWALILGAGLVFAARAGAARERFEQRPWKGFFVGLLVTGTAGVVSIGMAGSPVPLLKFLGLALLMSLMAVAAMGASGLCLMVSWRIRSLEPGLSLYASLTRAAMIIVVAAFFPMLGWFLLGPILFITSLGVGTQVVLARAEQPREVA